MTQPGGAPDVSGPSEPRSLDGTLTGDIGPLDIPDDLDATLMELEQAGAPAVEAE